MGKRKKRGKRGGREGKRREKKRGRISDMVPTLELRLLFFPTLYLLHVDFYETIRIDDVNNIQAQLFTFRFCSNLQCAVSVVI